jgi:hypothetical protein
MAAPAAPALRPCQPNVLPTQLRRRRPGIGSHRHSGTFLPSARIRADGARTRMQRTPAPERLAGHRAGRRLGGLQSDWRAWSLPGRGRSGIVKAHRSRLHMLCCMRVLLRFACECPGRARIVQHIVRSIAGLRTSRVVFPRHRVAMPARQFVPASRRELRPPPSRTRGGSMHSLQPRGRRCGDQHLE